MTLPFTPTPDRKWLQDVTLASRTAALTYFVKPNSCISSSRILIEALDRCNVKARPVPTFCRLMNEKAYNLSTLHVPIEQWPTDAWSLGIDLRTPEVDGGWNGHLCVMVRSGDRDFGVRRVFVDPSADQFDRPEHDLYVGGPVLFGVNDDQMFTPNDPLGTLLNRDSIGKRVITQYWPMPLDAHATKYRDAPDWNLDPAILDGIVTEVLEEVNK